MSLGNAFTKVFLGNGASLSGGTTTAPTTTDGFITTVATPTVTLAGMGPGYFGLFDAKTYKVPAAYTGCCPLVLASSSLYGNDKVGQFHGGYQETNKSKVINPKLIRKFYRVDPITAQNQILHVGTTPFTGVRIATVNTLVVGTNYTTNGTYNNVPLIGGTGVGATATVVVAANAVSSVTIVNPGMNYTVADVLTVSTVVVPNTGTDSTVTVATVSTADAGCDFEFMCAQTYNLRVDVKGAPALKLLTHNAYKTVSAYTGCCADDSIPTVVDSTLVMIEWAKQLAEDPIMGKFVQPVVYTEAGAMLATAASWDAYVSPGHVDGFTAGLTIYSAYVETKFGTCSFQPSDSYETEILKAYASMVDETGNPCAFTGICVTEECSGLQGQGFGETVIRDLILSESYLQNFLSKDNRIREITQGDDLLAAIDRTISYTRYYILHSVPRYVRDSGIYDVDQYMLEIITDGTNAAFESAMDTWLTTCNDCVVQEELDPSVGCTPVTPVIA